MSGAEPEAAGGRLTEPGGLDSVFLNLAGQVEGKLEQHLRFEAFITELSIRIISLRAEEVDGAIEDCQRRFCEVLGLDRSSLYQRFDEEPDALLLTHLYESSEHPIASSMAEKRSDPKLRSNIYWALTDPKSPVIYTRVDVKRMWPWVFRQLQHGEPVVVFGPDDLPQGAVQDREMFRKYGTQSTVIMPLFSGDTQLGCISFATVREPRKWSPLEVRRFRFVADLLANALIRKRADAAWRESEARFRQVAETTADFIWEVNAQGRYTYTSPSVERILGYTPAELVGKVYFYDLFAPAFREEIKTAAFQLFGTRKAFRRFPNPNIAKGGGLVYLETSGVPVLDEGGNLVGYRGSDTDVTERVKAHEDLLESERKFRALHESMRDAFASVDMSGRIKECNAAFQQLLGYSEAELHGRSYLDITPERWHDLEKKIIENQVLVQGYSEVFEKEYRKKDGTVFPVELRTFLIRDETGRPAGMWAIVREITERKRAEETLKESEARFRTLIENAGDGVEVLDEDGKHLDVNPARLLQLGYTREEMLGLSIFDINPNLDRERVKQDSQSSAMRWPMRLETINRRKDGTLFPVEAIVSPIQVGGRRCALALVRDITERKRTEAALRENEERLRLLLEANSEGVWDWNIASGKAYFSPRYSGMLGYEPEEFAKDYDAWKLLVHPDDFDRVHKAHGEHIHQGKDFCVEFRMRKKAGDWCWIRSRGMVVERDTEGNAIRMIGTHLDITGRKRTEDALLESSERLRLAAEATGFGAYAYDFEARRGSYSAEFLALYGLPPESELKLDAEGVPQAVHPEDKAAVLAAAKAANDPGGPGVFELEFRIRRYDNGAARWLRVRGRTVFSSTEPAGQPLRRHGVGQDITERKLAEQALLKSYAEIKLLKDRLQAESDYLKAEMKVSHAHGQIIGRSLGLKRVLHQTEQVAPADCPVLISGETGTGKELIAQEIHRLSARKERVMVLVNCAALPAALVESELFGRERGAYTGALTSQVGRFEVADGSTIFLDEVGELSMEVQAKLLRVLQQGEFQRLGSPKTHKVNVRVIAATNRDLAEDVRKGRFREDLYYRLRVFPIDIPPLRERADDIPLLVFTFMEEFATRMGKKITRIPRKAMEVLQAHSWPGNIRELRNVIEHSVILTSGDTLKLTVLGEAPTREAQPVTLAEAEREHILKTLESTGWRIKGPHGAAARLDLQPSTLYSRMQKLGIPHRRQKDEMATEG